MDLADLELKISVQTEEADTRIKGLEKNLNNLSKAVRGMVKETRMIGPLTNTTVSIVGKLDESIANLEGTGKKSLIKVRNNFEKLTTSALGVAKASRENILATKASLGAYNSLAERTQKLKDAMYKLNKEKRLANKRMRELARLSAESRVGLIQLTTARNGDTKAVLAAKQATIEYANILERQKILFGNTADSIDVYVEELKDELRETNKLTKDIREQEKAQKALNRAKAEAFKSQIRGVRKDMKGEDIALSSDMAMSSATTRTVLKESETALKEFDAKMKQMDTDAMQQWKSTVRQAKNESAAYYNEVQAHQQLQLTVQKSRIEGEREAHAQFKTTYKTAKTQAKIYYDEQKKRETDARKEFVSTYKTAKAQAEQYYDAVKAEEERLAQAAKLVNQAYMARMNALRDLAILTRQTGMALTRYFTTPLLAAAAMGVKFTAEMELQQKAFEILLGDVTAAIRLYGEVVEYAARTPYQLPELTQSVKELLAFGSASEDVMDEMRRLGDIAQNDAQKLDSVVKAFGKVQARGVAHMRELNRFIMAGVPIIGELGKVMNKSMEELFSAVQKGLVSFDAVKQAVENLTDEGGKFYNMSIEMSQLVSGRWSTLQDEFYLMLRSFVEDLMPAILQGINYVIDFFEAIRNMSREQRQAIRTTLMWVAALGPMLLLFSKIIAMMYTMEKLIKSISLAIKAMQGVKALSAVLSAIFAGLGGVPALITGIITALGAWAAWSGYQKIKNNIMSTVDGFRDLRSELDSISSLSNTEDIFDVINLRYNTTGGVEVFNKDVFEEYLASVEEPDWEQFLVTLDIREQAANTMIGAGERYRELMQTAVAKMQANLEGPVENIDMEQGMFLADLLKQHIFNPKEAMALEYALTNKDTEDFALYLAKGTKALMKGIRDGTIILDDETKRKLGRIGSKITAEGLEAVNASAQRVLSKDIVEKNPVDTLLKLFTKQLTGTVDTSGFADLSSMNEKFSALLHVFVSDTEEAIESVGARLNKYSTTIPGFTKFYDAVLAETGDLVSNMKALFPTLTPDEKAFYTFLEPFFGSAAEIKDFFKQYRAVITSEAKNFLSFLDVSYFMENLGAQITGTFNTATNKKSRAEYMIEGINAQLTEFVQGRGPKTLADIELALSEFEKLNPDIMKEYWKNITDLNKATVEIDYEKEYDKLQAGIDAYGAIGDAALTAAYKLKGFNSEQIQTLLNLNKTDQSLQALQSLMETPEADADKLKEALSVFDSNRLYGKLELSPTMPVRDQARFKEYFNRMFTSMNKKEADMWYSTDLSQRILGELEAAGGRLVFRDIEEDVRIAATNYFEALYGLDVSNQELLKAGETHKENLNKLLTIYGPETVSALEAEGLGEALGGIKDKLAVQVSALGKSANELLRASLEDALANGKILDKYKDEYQEIMEMLDKLEESDKFDWKQMFKDMGMDILETSMHGLVTSFQELGKAWATGSDGMQAFGNSLKEVVAQMIDNLPMLALNASLMAFSGGHWEWGLGLLALAGITALGGSYVSEKIRGSAESAPTIPSSSITFSAKGNIHKNGNVISAPTAFRTNSGLSIAGEAGDEAIMPLMRTSSGELGVAAIGSRNATVVNVPVNIEVVNETGTPVATESSSSIGPNGEKNIKLIIKKVVTEQMSKGEYDRVMNSRYGTKNRGVV